VADDIALTLLNDVRRAQQAWLDGRLADVRFEGRGVTDPWRLRATSVFQREGDEWRAVHRHADPLVHFRSLDETLALMAGPGRIATESPRPV